MSSLSSTTRTQNLSLLGSEHFDVLVIGGGVTGAGIALDAAERGYRVALVEKTDFAGGTSSKSTKLVHGGIRYLPNFDFSLVHEALLERGILLRNAPFLVHPIGFLLPIYQGDRHPVGMPFTTPGGVGLSQLLNIGLGLYDTLAGRENIHRHRHLSRAELLKLAPTLVPQGLKEGFVYYDAQTNDARLTMALVRTAAGRGATIANYAEVTAFLSENGKINGARVHDRLGEQELTVHARHVVNATGIFAEQVESLDGFVPQIQVEPSKGVHLVLSREKLQLGEDALVLPETADKRILFIVPWQSRAIFGTTDTGTGDLDHPVATTQDVSYLLAHLNRYLSVDLTEDDIISTYAGYRPLVSSRSTQHSTARLSRTHAVLQSPSGLVTIVGGKLTTYRRMAQDTVDVLSKRDGIATPPHPTQNLPLHGSVNWESARHELTTRGHALGLDEPVLKHLGANYGTAAGEILDLVEHDPALGTRLIDELPYLRAEVIHACRQEMAMTPMDVLARRMAITLEDRRQGLDVLEDVIDLLTGELGWSPAQQQQMSAAFRAQIESERAILQRDQEISTRGRGNEGETP